MTETRLLTPILAAALCAIAAPALAIDATDDVYVGIEPNRTMHHHFEVQKALRADPAWQDFLAGEGTGWTVRFDEDTGAPYRMFGTGIPVDTSSEFAVLSGVRAFLGRHADLLRVSPKRLSGGIASYAEHLDTWYVEIPVRYDGLPVYRGSVQARVKHGNLVLLGVEAYDGVPREGEAVIDASEAVAIAIDLGPAAGVDHRVLSSAPLWLPLKRGNDLTLVRAFEVHTITQDPIGEWISFVDAETGELLNVHNDVRFYEIRGEHHPRHPGQELTTSPLYELQVITPNGNIYTDANGQFSADGGSFTAQLRGRDIRVRDARDGQISGADFTAGDYTLRAGSSITQAELNTFIATQDIQEWGRRVAPDVNVGNNNMVANVNVDGSCNAFYSPNQSSINFYRESSRCNNTGLIADVVYHEWGHGFHAWSLRTGTYDGSLGEGTGDIIAALQTRDAIMAPYFNKNGSGIRNMGPDRVYPRDVVGEVHTDGLIFAGALWDLIGVLEPEYGRDEAEQIVGELLAGALKAGPTIPSSGEEILLADDDDGNLGNGTPHFCEIVDAFGRHGLVPQAGASALLQHDQLVESPQVDGVELVAVVEDNSIDCVQIDEIDIVWRTAGGDWRTETAAVVDGEAKVVLPPLEFGTFVEYYAASGEFMVPSTGEFNPLSLYVGGVLDVYCNDFERTDGGFTHELLAGEEREGADDWMWAEPLGLGGDPAIAHSGFFAWGNDLGGGNFNGQYQGDKHNRLTSPVIDTEHYEGTFLRYARWLNVEDGRFDRAQILADGEVVWSNHDSGSDNAGEHHQDSRWVIHSVDLDDAGDDGEVQLAWEIISDGGLNMGGWTIDDVCVFAPATPNNRLAILDFQAGDNEEGGVTLTWTNPIHDPVAEVIVVRNQDAWPTGPDDGEVVFRDDAPVVGADMTAFDETGKRNREYFYAVYGGDGTDFLGWTVEGRNADMGSGFGQPKRGVLAAGGCGCSSSAAPTSLAFFGLAGLLLAWRRRRS